MNNFRKWAYVILMGGLTCSAMSACYWQTNKYLLSTARWKSIKQQLNKQNPDNLSNHQNDDNLYPFKYLMVEGRLSSDYERVERRKQNRMGYLIIRALKYNDFQGKQKQICALQGWCQQSFNYTPKQALQKPIKMKGILREKQKKDFLHDNFKKQDIQRYKMNTYINIDGIIDKLKINRNNINQKYYLQILRSQNAVQYQDFPYQYTVDNFQLPYLTPDKHFGYATFWGCCSLLGISTIFKVLRFK